MWPDISPASSACSSFILALISEWPVLYMIGLPPRRFSSSYSTCEHFTSPMNVAPGLRVRISRAVDQQQHVAVNHFAVLVHRADAVRIAVERDAKIGVARLYALCEGAPDSPAPSDRDDDSGNGRPCRRTARSRRTSSLSNRRCMTGPAVPLPASSTTLIRRLELELRRDLVQISRDDVHLIRLRRGRLRNPRF